MENINQEESIKLVQGLIKKQKEQLWLKAFEENGDEFIDFLKNYKDENGNNVINLMLMETIKNPEIINVITELTKHVSLLNSDENGLLPSQSAEKKNNFYLYNFLKNKETLEESLINV